MALVIDLFGFFLVRILSQSLFVVGVGVAQDISHRMVNILGRLMVSSWREPFQNKVSMPYSAEISRANPSCFIFLIDQSGSMEDPIGSSTKRKSDSVADAINRLLQNLIIKCARGDGVRDFYEVAVIGYGASVGSAFSGPLAGRELVRLSELANHPARIEERVRMVDDGAGGLMEQKIKFPIWFEPTAGGATPMGQALRLAHQWLMQWVKDRPNSFPPIVINITDGEATDTGPAPQAEDIAALETKDGPALLLNCHISDREAEAVIFPDSDENLMDDFARLLFQVSSVLPPSLRELARSEGFRLGPDSRGFAFNADLVELIRFLDIGTRSGGGMR
jgi:hypothetical protein